MDMMKMVKYGIVMAVTFAGAQPAMAWQATNKPGVQKGTIRHHNGSHTDRYRWDGGGMRHWTSAPGTKSGVVRRVVISTDARLVNGKMRPTTTMTKTDTMTKKGTFITTVERTRFANGKVKVVKQREQLTNAKGEVVMSSTP